MVKSLDKASVRGLPRQPSACPTYPSARGPLDEGELLGCQQDPVAAAHQLPLLDSGSGGRGSAGHRDGTHITPTSLGPLGPALTFKPSSCVPSSPS